MTLKEQKQKYVENELESCFDDMKFVNEILSEYFFKMVKYMNRQQFKDYITDLGWDYEDYKTMIGEK
jgi:hypothetical protein